MNRKGRPGTSWSWLHVRVESSEKFWDLGWMWTPGVRTEDWGGGREMLG